MVQIHCHLGTVKESFAIFYHLAFPFSSCCIVSSSSTSPPQIGTIWCWGAEQQGSSRGSLHPQSHASQQASEPYSPSPPPPQGAHDLNVIRPCHGGMKEEEEEEEEEEKSRVLGKVHIRCIWTQLLSRAQRLLSVLLASKSHYNFNNLAACVQKYPLCTYKLGKVKLL